MIQYHRMIVTVNQMFDIFAYLTPGWTARVRVVTLARIG